MKIVTKTQIREYPLLSRGKVRDIYAISDETLLIVTTDRMSAFDVIIPEPIPYKGVVLNQITLFWMDGSRTGRQPPPGHRRARFPAALAPHADVLRRPLRHGPQGQAPAHRVHRARLPDRLGLQGLQGHGFGMRLQAPAGEPGNPTSSRTPLFTPSTKADLGARREHHRGRRHRASARGCSTENPGAVPGHLRGPRPGRGSTGSSSPTPSSSSA
jgi:phosphoribosylaminoimidazole-succinocarboxamide synthase